jgi:NRPS condensation-like uncharacterized protein
MKRKITEIEKDYITRNMPLYIRFGVCECFQINKIINSLKEVIKKYPSLRSVIKDNYIIAQKDYDVDITECEKIQDDQRIFKYKLDPKKNLVKLLFSKEKSGTHFLMIIHHAICDAVSASLVIEDFVQGLFLPKKLEKNETIPKSIEDFFEYLPTKEQTGKYAKSFKENLAKINKYPIEASEDCKSLKMKIFQVEKKQLEKILKFAKEKDVTVNSLISAMLIKALKLEGVYFVGTTVDLKRRMKNVPLDHFINAPVVAYIYLDLKKDASIEDIAKKYQVKLYELIDSDDFLCQHYSQRRGQLRIFDYDTGFFMSNIGKTHFSKNIEEKISYLYFSLEVCANFPMVFCATHLDKMIFSFSFQEKFSSSIDEMMSAFQD